MVYLLSIITAKISRGTQPTNNVEKLILAYILEYSVCHPLVLLLWVRGKAIQHDMRYVAEWASYLTVAGSIERRGSRVSLKGIVGPYPSVIRFSMTAHLLVVTPLPSNPKVRTKISTCGPLRTISYQNHGVYSLYLLFLPVSILLHPSVCLISLPPPPWSLYAPSLSVLIS